MKFLVSDKNQVIRAADGYVTASCQNRENAINIATLLERDCLNPLDVTRVNNDVNGNPRYVVHFLALLTDEERARDSGRYELALKKSRKFGGRKFHNKQYGGGIVFSSYNLNCELAIINEISGNNFEGYEVAR